MNQKFNIDEELRDLFPHLTSDEFDQLEKNILREGCRDPIATWDGYIVDGHNRYSICMKHNLQFHTFILVFDTKDEVISWMVDTQLGRRNLTPAQRIAVAEKYRPVYEKQAEKNSKQSGEQFGKGLPILAEPIKPINTRDELAKKAGVSHGTYDKGKKILDFEKNKGEDLTTEEKDIIEKVKSGEVKINTGYKYLFKSDSKTKDNEWKKVEKSIAMRLAKEHQVSVRTIREDGKYAIAVNLISDTFGIEAKYKILKGETAISKSGVIAIGNILSRYEIVNVSCTKNIQF